MEELSKDLQCINLKKMKLNKEEEFEWKKTMKILSEGVTLESALSKYNSNSVTQLIVRETWKILAKDDLALMEQSYDDKVKFALANLITEMFHSSNNIINIITTNYDRVIEYAIDSTDFNCLTGFRQGIIRQLEGADLTTVWNGENLARIVRVWKVHGSLDWFKSVDGERVMSLPLTNDIPDGLSPLIITPGVEKYEKTHFRPYNSIMQGANSALEKANGVLCVGYGFQDQHIQEKLAERCLQDKIPIVILAKKLTDSANNFIRKYCKDSYLAMEEGLNGTKIFSAGGNFPEVEEIRGCSYWRLCKFNELVF